jgi:hypothetical protein
MPSALMQALLTASPVNQRRHWGWMLGNKIKTQRLLVEGSHELDLQLGLKDWRPLRCLHWGAKLERLWEIQMHRLNGW